VSDARARRPSARGSRRSGAAAEPLVGELRLVSRPLLVLQGDTVPTDGVWEASLDICFQSEIVRDLDRALAVVTERERARLVDQSEQVAATTWSRCSGDVGSADSMDARCGAGIWRAPEQSPRAQRTDGTRTRGTSPAALRIGAGSGCGGAARERQGPPDDVSDDEWLAELNRRADSVRRTERVGEPWSLVRDELLAELKR
jgi:hypothetical protein